jgi:aminoglycoside phosphotransferase (APT) family kinase protein
MAMSGETDLADGLARFLSEQTEARSVTIENLTRLLGGAIHHTWAFDAVFDGGSLPGRFELILRIDAPGRAQPEVMALEYHLLDVMHGVGVPVPKVYFLGDESLGAPFFIMERVAGETNPRHLFREDRYAEARARMAGQLGDILARIHRVTLERLPLGLLRGPPAGVPPAAYEIDRLEVEYRELCINPHPVFELAFRWLREQKPARRADRALVLVHGDYRMGNVLFDRTGVRAVLDWEGAHLGDPMEDLGWFCVRAWRFGNDHLPAGGLATLDELAAGYEAGGLAVHRDEWLFWEVFGNLRWGVVTVMQAKTHLDGQVRSQELAAIGRRTAETEYEILRLIG